MIPTVFAALVVAAVPARAYLWPSPQLDALENLRYDQTGFNPNGIIFFVNPCNQFLFGNVVGRSNAADWIRTAYHDMATHNKTSGIGGLDASIQFELDRPENAGTSFVNTIPVVSGQASRYVSIADSIALGALLAYEQCGGPALDFRGGRVDAKKAGPPGVPEPQQSLASHTASFARQGFSATEMIGLIACGHTFGGVQHSAFPTIVPASAVTSNNTDGQETFDTTPTAFDNRIATEFIAGTTKNPLVVGHNVTTRSDDRIFSSDRNKTIESFAKSLSHYTSTCASLISRMINTVPSSVKLTDVIKPLPAKPHNIQLFYGLGNVITIFGQARFINLDATSPPQATLHWLPRTGGKSTAGSLVHTSNMIGASPHTGQHVWYQFGETNNTNGAAEGFSFPASKGIEKFWFTLSDGKTFDQGGSAFPVDDTVMFAYGSCFNFSGPSVPTVTLRVAVRKAAGKPSKVWIESDSLDFTLGGPLSGTINITTFTASPVHPPNPSSDLYAIYSVTGTNFNLAVGGAVIKATINGKTHETLRFQPLNSQVILPTCDPVNTGCTPGGVCSIVPGSTSILSVSGTTASTTVPQTSIVTGSATGSATGVKTATATSTVTSSSIKTVTATTSPHT